MLQGLRLLTGCRASLASGRAQLLAGPAQRLGVARARSLVPVRAMSGEVEAAQKAAAAG